MTLGEYDDFCAAMPGSTHVVQWGEAHVWKVCGKVFALAWADNGGEIAVSFKCSPMAFDILRQMPGLRPAPYMASRGLKWIQRYASTSMDDDALKDYLRESRRLVIQGLTKKARLALEAGG